jgi:hypothetical protein
MRNAKGADIKYLYNYVPNIMEPNQTGNFNQWVYRNKDVLMTDGKTTLGEAFKDAQDRMLKDVNATTDPKKIRSFAEFERTKKDMLPEELKGEYDSFFVSDPADKLLYYVESNARAYADDIAFGGKDGLEKIRLEITGNDGDKALKFFDRIRNQTVNPTSTRALENVRTMQILTKMQMAGFTNSTQTVNTIAFNGAKNTTQAIKEVTKAIKNPAYKRQLIDRATQYGMDLNPLFDELTNTANADVVLAKIMGKEVKSGIGQRTADTMLTWNGFKYVEQNNRLIAMLSTENKLTGLQGKLDAGGALTKTEQRWLQLVGISPEEIMMKGGIDAEMFGNAIKQGVGKTQFYTGPKDMPEIVTRSPFWRAIFTLQNFSIKQGEFVKDVVLKEVAHGNFAPMAKYFGFGIPAGGANMAVKGGLTIGAVNLLLAPFGGKLQEKKPGTSVK